jgi:hypothetical protein
MMHLTDDHQQAALEVYLYLGVLMNLPVLPPKANRPFLSQLISSQDDCVSLLFAVLSEPKLCNAHVIALQILTMLCNQNVLHGQSIRLLSQAVKAFVLCPFPSVSAEFGADMDITFSLRDVADFFLPLLRSRYRCCVEFAQLCIVEAYFNSRSKWKPGYLFSVQATVIGTSPSGSETK